MNTKSINSDNGADYSHLLKFVIASAVCFFVGTVHGVLQVMRPIRAWLDSIGSPYGGPGHMIDPLAHAHINVVGGVVVFIMGTSYYLIPHMGKIAVYSRKLVNHTFWWTVLGIAGFYSTLMIFGILEGMAMLNNPNSDESVQAIHRFYGPVIGTVSTVMGMGFWIYFINIFMTIKKKIPLSN